MPIRKKHGPKRGNNAVKTRGFLGTFAIISHYTPPRKKSAAKAPVFQKPARPWCGRDAALRRPRPYSGRNES